MEEAVRLEKLTKKYGDLTAVNAVDLCVEKGELFGLLGVNGAGKTTIIKVLCGLTPPTDGEAFVFGKSVKNQIAEVKRLIDLSPQETSVAPNLTVRENLYFFASLYYKDKAEREQAVREVIETFGMSEQLSKRAKTLSGGWQRRLSIAVALVSRPKVLFLDEPTLGLDVLARRELWEVIKSIKPRTTIVLTSHYLEEIEALCDRVAIMADGNVVAAGTVEEIKTLAGEQDFEEAFIKLVKGAKI